MTETLDQSREKWTNKTNGVCTILKRERKRKIVVVFFCCWSDSRQKARPFVKFKKSYSF